MTASYQVPSFNFELPLPYSIGVALAMAIIPDNYDLHMPFPIPHSAGISLTKPRRFLCLDSDIGPIASPEQQSTPRFQSGLVPDPITTPQRDSSTYPRYPFVPVPPIHPLFRSNPEPPPIPRAHSMRCGCGAWDYMNEY